jgi:hypothetical protein
MVIWASIPSAARRNEKPDRQYVHSVNIEAGAHRLVKAASRDRDKCCKNPSKVCVFRKNRISWLKSKNQ